MTCLQFRRVADSFLSKHLTAELSHDVLRHLDVCPSCRADVDGRRRLRAALRIAVDRTPELQAQPDFSARLRTRLREEARGGRTRAISRRSWLALAAGLVLAIGLTGRLDRETVGCAGRRARAGCDW